MVSLLAVLLDYSFSVAQSFKEIHTHTVDSGIIHFAFIGVEDLILNGGKENITFANFTVNNSDQLKKY